MYCVYIGPLVSLGHTSAVAAHALVTMTACIIAYYGIRRPYKTHKSERESRFPSGGLRAQLDPETVMEGITQGEGSTVESREI